MKNSHRYSNALLILTLAFAHVTAFAQSKAKPASAGKTIKVNFKDVKLKSGPRVLLVEEHSAPVVPIAAFSTVEFTAKREK